VPVEEKHNLVVEEEGHSDPFLAVVGPGCQDRLANGYLHKVGCDQRKLPRQVQSLRLHLLGAVFSPDAQ
jgi:hypothetical protein